MSRRETVYQFLRTGAVVRLYVQVACPGVVVPKQHHGVAALCLDIGLLLPNPIRDLELGNAGVHGTLSFGGSPFYCQVPYEALIGVQNMATGEVVGFPCGAEPIVVRARDEGTPPTERLPPTTEQQAGAKVIDFVEAGNRIRLARARKANRGR